MAAESVADGQRYAVAFVDMRMPPGWNGITTIGHLWEGDPDLEIVICTAFSDHSWSETLEILGRPDRLVLLKKPFSSTDVRTLARLLTFK